MPGQLQRKEISGAEGTTLGLQKPLTCLLEFTQLFFFSLQPYGRLQVTCETDYIIASEIMCIRVGQVQ